MKITLSSRTEETVRICFEKTQDEEIRNMLPSAAKNVGEALSLFHKAERGETNSFGRTVIADGRYVGDVWAYCIDPEDEPSAMLSFCVFEKQLWNAGVATQAVGMFLGLLREKFAVKTIGAFTFLDNTGSIRVLEKNGFRIRERFSEDGRESCYLETQ